jgi:hypothetical protein
MRGRGIGFVGVSGIFADAFSAACLFALSRGLVFDALGGAHPRYFSLLAQRKVTKSKGKSSGVFFFAFFLLDKQKKEGLAQ